MPMTHRWRYLWLRAQAYALLLLGQLRAAAGRFDAMLALVPNDRYAMASRAHLLAQAGERVAAVSALRELTNAHPQDAAACYLTFWAQALRERSGWLASRAAAMRSISAWMAAGSPGWPASVAAMTTAPSGRLEWR